MRLVTLAVLATSFSVAVAGCASETVAPVTPDESVSLERVNNTFKYPFAFTTFNPCPPMEPVAVEGVVHVNQHGNVEPGSTEFKTHVVLHGNGVGLLTGSKYVLQQNNKSEFSSSFPPPRLESSSDFRYRLIRQGSEDDFHAHGSATFVCDQNGCRVVENEQERACRG